jgi:hypothetical protein
MRVLRQLAYAHEVVSGKGGGEGYAGPFEPVELGLTQTADAVQPAYDLLDALAFFLERADAAYFAFGWGYIPRIGVVCNALRPAAVFADLFARMALQAQRGRRRALAETTYLIDSTEVRLTGTSDWARFSVTACGAKVHVIYDADADRPIYV